MVILVTVDITLHALASHKLVIDNLQRYKNYVYTIMAAYKNSNNYVKQLIIVVFYGSTHRGPRSCIVV